MNCKFLFITLSAIVISLFSGCTTAEQTTLKGIAASALQPASIQQGITTTSSQLLPAVSSQAKATIHTAATNLLAISQSNLTPSAITAILTQAKVSLPSADQAILAEVIDGAVAVLNLAVAEYGSSSPTVLSYVQAVANGFLNAGY